MDPEQIDISTEEPTITRVDTRLTDLSKKVKDTAGERDVERHAREAAEKERDFYKDFSQTSAQFPQANDHMEAIKDKVMSGYSVKDATVSVLNEEGKLMPPPQAPPPPPRPAAGGSALTNPPEGGMKQVSEMSRDEKRAALVEAEKRGDISLS